MRHIISILLVLLLLAGQLGCQPVLDTQESWVDLPIITQGEQSSTGADTSTAVRTTEAAATFEAEPAALTEPVETTTESAAPETLSVTEDGVYDSKEAVALYIHSFGHLPSNYITKKEAESLGWKHGTALETYAPGKCIGGSHFGNYERLLPDAKGRSWTECDIDTLGAESRGTKRIVFSNDGLIYYTEDHYEHFELLYGGED